MSEQIEFGLDSKKTIQEQFLTFHRKNPAIYDYFKQFALEMQRSRGLISANMVINRIRWEVMVKTKSDDGFKVNNNFSSRYARMFIDEFPEHKDRISFREVRTK